MSIARSIVSNGKRGEATPIETDGRPSEQRTLNIR
jgi:hypothetical protein